ncbi:hypothetical protein Syun_016355 [Stephania yunnanensis]|uniref:Uncharacterized protein n=1 Tax=Stephania yunnanensis TaxID=152371 RepID=A0AAP0J512_9MAGN
MIWVIFMLDMLIVLVGFAISWLLLLLFSQLIKIYGGIFYGCFVSYGGIVDGCLVFGHIFSCFAHYI